MSIRVNKEQRGIENRGLTIPHKRTYQVQYPEGEQVRKEKWIIPISDVKVLTRKGRRHISEVIGEGFEITIRTYKTGEWPQEQFETYQTIEKLPPRGISNKERGLPIEEPVITYSQPKPSPEKSKPREKRKPIKKPSKPAAFKPEEGEYDSMLKGFDKAVEEYKEKQRMEMIEKLHFDPKLLGQAYLASMQRAMSEPNPIYRDGEFRRLTWALHVGLKISKNWDQYKKRYLFSGEETLYQFAERYTQTFLRKEYFPGFIASFTGRPTEEKINKILQTTLEYFDSTSLESPIGYEGRELIREAYRTIVEFEFYYYKIVKDYRGNFRIWLTKDTSYGVNGGPIKMKLESPRGECHTCVCQCFKL